MAAEEVGADSSSSGSESPSEAADQVADVVSAWLTGGPAGRGAGSRGHDDDDLVNLGSTFGATGLSLGSTLRLSPVVDSSTSRGEASGRTRRGRMRRSERSLTFDEWSSLKDAYEAAERQRRDHLRVSKDESKATAVEKARKAFQSYSQRYLKDKALALLEQLYEESKCEAVPSARGGGCTEETCVNTLGARPDHMGCTPLEFSSRSNDNETWVAVGTALASIELGFYKSPGGDSATAALGPLAEAWINWTKASGRVFEDVNVSRRDAQLLRNKDEDGNLSTVLPTLRYTVRGGEMKLLRPGKFQQNGGFERTHFVLENLSSDTKACNRIYHQKVVNQWYKCRRASANRAAAETKRQEENEAGAGDTGESTRGDETNGSSTFQHRLETNIARQTRSALKKLAKWAEEDVVKKEKALADLHSRIAKQSKQQFTSWHSSKDTAAFTLPSTEDHKSLVTGALPLAYTGAGFPVPPGGQQYMRAGNRSSVPQDSAALRAMLSGKTRAWAIRSQDPSNPWADLRASRTLIARIKRLQVQADDEKTEREEASKQQFMKWAERKDRVNNCRQLLSKLDRAYWLGAAARRDRVGKALHAIDRSLLEVYQTWVIVGTVDPVDPHQFSRLGPQDEALRRRLQHQWSHNCGPISGLSEFAQQRIDAAKRQATSLREQAYFAMGADDPISEHDPSFLSRYTDAQCKLREAEAVLRQATKLYHVNSITFMQGEPLAPRDVPLLDADGKDTMGIEAHACVNIGDSVNLEDSETWWDIQSIDWKSKRMVIAPSSVRSLGPGALVYRLVKSGAKSKTSADARSKMLDARRERTIPIAQLIGKLVYRRAATPPDGCTAVLIRVPEPPTDWGVACLNRWVAEQIAEEQENKRKALQNERREQLAQLTQWRKSAQTTRVLFARAALRRLNPNRANNFELWRELGAALFLIHPGPAGDVADSVPTKKTSRASMLPPRAPDSKTLDTVVETDTASRTGSGSSLVSESNEMMLSEWPEQMKVSDDSGSESLSVSSLGESLPVPLPSRIQSDEGSTSDTSSTRPGCLFDDWVSFTKQSEVWSSTTDAPPTNILKKLSASEWQRFLSFEAQRASPSENAAKARPATVAAGALESKESATAETSLADLLRGATASEAKGAEDEIAGSDHRAEDAVAEHDISEEQLTKWKDRLLESEARTELAAGSLLRWVEEDGGWGSDVSESEADDSDTDSEQEELERLSVVAARTEAEGIEARTVFADERSVRVVWGDSRTSVLRIGFHADEQHESESALRDAQYGMRGDQSSVLQDGPLFVLDMEMPHHTAVAADGKVRDIYGGRGAARVPHFVEVYRGYACSCLVSGLESGSMYRFRIRHGSEHSGLPQTRGTDVGVRGILQGKVGAIAAPATNFRAPFYLPVATLPGAPDGLVMLSVKRLGDDANWIELSWEPSVGKDFKRQYKKMIPWQLERESDVGTGAWARFISYELECREVAADRQWYTLYSGRLPRALVGAFKSGARYQFRVRARLAFEGQPCATSEHSKCLKVTIPAPRVLPPRLRLIGTDRANISWKRLLQANSASGSAMAPPPAQKPRSEALLPEPVQPRHGVELDLVPVPEMLPDEHFPDSIPESLASPVTEDGDIRQGSERSRSNGQLGVSGADQDDGEAADAATVVTESIGEHEEAASHSGETDKEAWLPVFDPKTGRAYYFEPLSRRSVWEVPGDVRMTSGGWNTVLSACGVEHDTATNSDVWIEIWEPRRRVCYYYNLKSGVSAWHPPTNTTVMSEADDVAAASGGGSTSSGRTTSHDTDGRGAARSAGRTHSESDASQAKSHTHTKDEDTTGCIDEALPGAPHAATDGTSATEDMVEDSVMTRVRRSLVVVHHELHWDSSNGKAPLRRKLADTEDKTLPQKEVDGRFKYSVTVEGPCERSGSAVTTVFDGTAGACTILGLLPNSKYKVRVRSIQADGGVRGRPSRPLTIVTMPLPPQDIALAALTTSSADLTWIAGEGGAAQYAVLIAKLPSRVSAWTAQAGSLPNYDALQQAGVKEPKFICVYKGQESWARIYGLTPGQTYVARVYALNSKGIAHDQSGYGYKEATEAADGCTVLVTTKSVGLAKQRAGAPKIIRYPQHLEP